MALVGAGGDLDPPGAPTGLLRSWVGRGYQGEDCKQLLLKVAVKAYTGLKLIVDT